jgi:hypothetical protein
VHAHLMLNACRAPAFKEVSVVAAVLLIIVSSLEAPHSAIQEVALMYATKHNASYNRRLAYPLANVVSA